MIQEKYYKPYQIKTIYMENYILMKKALQVQWIN
jgi:hypothetical protein